MGVETLNLHRVTVVPAKNRKTPIEFFIFSHLTLPTEKIVRRMTFWQSEFKEEFPLNSLVYPARRISTCSDASSSVTSMLIESSEISICRDLSSIDFSPADRPLEDSRRARLRTTSAT